MDILLSNAGLQVQGLRPVEGPECVPEISIFETMPCQMHMCLKKSTEELPAATRITPTTLNHMLPSISGRADMCREG